MVRPYQPPKQGKVLDRSSIFFLLVLNSSLLHKPFLCSTVRCYTYRSYYCFSSLLHRPFSFYNSSLLVFNSSLLHIPVLLLSQFAVTQTVLILQQFAVAQTVLILIISDVLNLVNS